MTIRPVLAKGVVVEAQIERKTGEITVRRLKFPKSVEWEMESNGWQEDRQRDSSEVEYLVDREMDYMPELEHSEAMIAQSFLLLVDSLHPRAFPVFDVDASKMP